MSRLTKVLSMLLTPGTGAYAADCEAAASQLRAFIPQEDQASVFGSTYSFERWSQVALIYTSASRALEIGEGDPGRLRTLLLSSDVLIDCWRPPAKTGYDEDWAAIANFDELFNAAARDEIRKRAQTLR